jgi:hypothetical protein
MYLVHLHFELGKLAEWFTAIGTIATAIIAVYLANRDNTLRLQAFATVGVAVGTGVPIAQAPRYLWIQVTNVGRRAATITNIGWRSGMFSHRIPIVCCIHSVQSFMPTDGPSFPVKLNDGEVARWWIPFDPWLLNNSTAMLRQRLVKFHLRTTCLQVFTSTNRMLTIKIHRTLRDKLLDLVTPMQQCGLAWQPSPQRPQQCPPHELSMAQQRE